jgi:hypothetical protein
MWDLFRLIGGAVVDLLRSRAALEAEIWTLRQQINVLRRTAPKRLSFNDIDPLVFAGLYWLFPNICDALAIVKPDAIVRWHRVGLRLYWRSRLQFGLRQSVRDMTPARNRAGRPKVCFMLGPKIGQTLSRSEDAAPCPGDRFRSSETRGRCGKSRCIQPRATFRTRSNPG